jgi:hypothetical protein
LSRDGRRPKSEYSFGQSLTRFAEPDHRKRGRALESILNDLFRNFDILIKESFSLRGSHGEGILEQIDGAVELNGQVFLVEIKW